MTNPPPIATVVIPQFGRAELTCACIRSLRREETTPWPIIVVDDGSPPESPRRVEAEQFPEITVIPQSHRGVSAAWNRGAVEVRTPYVVFLNNDVLFRGPALERLLAPLSSGRALIAGVRLRTEQLLPRRILEALPSDRFLEGWCLATSMDDFQHLDGFDESLAVYWSDTDFQARMIEAEAIDRSAVCPLHELPDLPLSHLGHRTAHRIRDRRGLWQKDRNRFIAKWDAR